MLFNDTIFLLWFLPVVLLLYGCFPAKRTPILLAANYVFYGWWNVWFCLLMLTSTTVDYLAGKYIFQSQNDARRKILLLCSLCINLSLLGFFKYFGLLSETINALASAAWLPTWNIVLPVGISFYGKKWSEPKLIEIAYSYEQKTKHRKKPEFLVSD